MVFALLDQAAVRATMASTPSLMATVQRPGPRRTASPEHTARVTDAWASVYPQLRRLGIAQWTSSAIDEGVQRPLARYMAGELAVEFGFTGPRLQAIMMEADMGWRQLNEQAAGDRHQASKKFKDY